MTRKEWIGWKPCQSEINGDPTGLLRMDSLHLDDDGNLSLIPGSKKVSGQFTGNIRKIFSRYMGGKKLRYVHNDGPILRNYGGSASVSVFDKGFIGSSGSQTNYAAFGVCFGQVIACTGSNKRMDDGTNDYDIGIAAPSAPTVSANTPPAIDCQALSGGAYTNWEAVEGSSVTNSSSYFQADSDATSYRLTTQVGRTSALTLDTTNFSGTGNHTLDDIFKFSVRPSDSSKLVKVRIEFLLEAPTSPSTTQDIKNFLWYEWNAKETAEVEMSDDISFDTSFRQGVNVWTRLGCKRSDFNRVGTDFSKDWNAVKGIRVIFTCTEAITCMFTDLYFTGGITGPLNGYYEYKQVNCYDTGDFVMEGLPSDASATVGSVNCSNQVTPAATAAPTNKVKIYRRGGKLGQFYLVKEVSSPYAAFADTLSDDDAILTNEVLNEYTIAVPDNVIGIEAPYFERAIYLRKDMIVPSLPNDFSRVDSRHIIENCASAAEENLFIAKVSEQTILIGTTNEIYSLSGDGTYDSSTGLLNFTLAPLGIKKPPISEAFLIEDNSLIYLASDGWRRLAGSNSIIINPDLELLYRGEERYGIDGVSTLTSPVSSSVVLSKGRLLITMDHKTDGRLLEVFSLKKQYWSLAYAGISGFTPFSLFVEEDGTVLCGTDSGGDRYLRELFVGTLWDEASAIPIQVETIYDDFGEKFRRKDSYAWKLQADSGNDNVTIVLYKDGNSTPISLGTAAFNGTSESISDISSLVGKAKSIKLKLTGNFDTFKLFGYQLMADLLPEQTNFYRIQPSNLGTQSRKRLLNFPVVIDCLGNNVVFKPYVDGAQVTDALANPASSTFSNNGKATQTHWFDKEILGTDVSGILTCASGVFEFYEPLFNEIVSEKLPISTKWMAIPQQNFGTYALKRFNRLPFVLNPRGATVSVIPVLDGVQQTAQTFTGSYKQTFNYVFTTDATASDIGFIISASAIFEFYEILKPEVLETFPEPAKFLRTIPENMGTPAKKRFNNIPFVINTNGSAVSVVPVLDGVDQASQSFTTSSKETVAYYFSSDVKAKDISLKISGANYFFFYEILKPEQLEVLPAPVRFLRLLPQNFGTYARKRFNRISFVMDTEASVVSVVPVLDGVEQVGQNFSSTFKQTLSYFFSGDVVARDVALIVSGASDFYFYEMLKPEMMEILPEPVTFLRIPQNDFGTYARKRFDNIPFILDSRGSTVSITPVLDGVEGTPQNFSTSRKEVTSFFFTDYQVARSVSLNILGGTEFEFYGILEPKRMEVLPDPTKHLFIPASNFGTAGKKRLRTLPIVINTNGADVTFTPIVDGVAKTASTFNTTEKQTVFHYFTESDGVLGIDFSGTLSSDSEFEFYEMLKPEQVEILPVGKKYDQLGPLQLERSGRAQMLILNLLCEGTSLTCKIYAAGSATALYTKTITTLAGIQDTYDVFLPKGINSSILRFELISDSVFYRFSASARVDTSGDGTKFKVVKFGN